MSRLANVVSGIIAAGTNLATATAIAKTTDVAVIGTCAAGTGVVLPFGSPSGKEIKIRNDGATSLSVYAQGLSGTASGATINGTTGSTAFLIQPGVSTTLTTQDGLAWTTTSYATQGGVVSVAAAATLTPAQSGSIVLISQAAAYTVTLPSPTIIGLRYDIVNGTSGANTVKIDGGAGLLLGTWNNDVAGSLTGATTAGTAVQYFQFLTGASVIGDHATFISTGVKWICNAWGGAAACFSFA